MCVYATHIRAPIHGRFFCAFANLQLTIQFMGLNAQRKFGLEQFR